MVKKESVKMAEREEEAGYYSSAARLYKKAGELDRASKAYEHANHAEAYKEEGEMWERAGEAEKATDAYIKGGWYGVAGKMWEKMGKPEKAAKVYERSNLPGAIRLGVEIYEKLGNTKKAEELRKKLEKK